MQIYPIKIDFDVWSAISAAFPGRVRMALTGDPHLNVKMKKGEDILTFLHQMFGKYTEYAQENNASES